MNNMLLFLNETVLIGFISIMSIPYWGLYSYIETVNLWFKLQQLLYNVNPDLFVKFQEAYEKQSWYRKYIL